MKNKLRKLCFFLSMIFAAGNAHSQTFDCFISNDHLVSATVFELDVNIVSTSTSFNLRSVQNCIIFNPAFFNPSATITVTYVANSTQMVSYNIPSLSWSSSGYGFQTPTNTGVTCPTGTLVGSTPIRIATYRLESTLPFNCAPSAPQMVIQGNTSPPGLVLKMAVTAWNTLDCSSGLNSTITSGGTYTQFVPNTLYTQVNNMRPQITSQPHNATACNAGLVSFSVTATANAGISQAISYQWFENGNPVSNGTTANGTYSGATTATLTITNPSVAISGHQFYCVVTQCNSDTTQTVVITGSANDNNACTTDACDPSTGVITNTPVNTDDGNACTADACDPATGIITHPAINTDDNNACTTDGCDQVTGVYHNSVNTNDNNPCTADACDPLSGSVTHTAINTDDGDACTVDGCDPVNGLYHTPLNINDNDPCTTDGCDNVTGVVTHTPVNVDDNNACTTDGCDPVNGVFHNAVVIDDGNACTADNCNSFTGAITHTAIPVNDNNACTTDGCDPATGVFHTPVVTDDNNICTTDNCNTSTGAITHTNVNTNDNNACTTDGCDPVTGVFHTPVNVDDGIQCTLDACDPSTGNITHTNITSASPALTVSNQCGYSVLNATGFTGTLLWSTGATTASITVQTGGLYSVTQTISGCTSPPGFISASPLSVPSVSLGNDTLVQATSIQLNAGSGFVSYLWSTGATTQSISVQSSGYFWVTVSNSNCSASDTIFVDFFTAIEETPFEKSFAIFPNPSLGNFTIAFKKAFKQARFEIYNANGKLIYKEEKSNMPSNALMNLSLDVAKGIYLLKVNSGDEVCIHYLVIE